MEYSSIEQLLESLISDSQSSDKGSGVELDYDPEFIDLENMLNTQPEQQYGDTIIPAAGPDWSKALPKAMQLLEKSRDFRLVTIITRAATHRQGLNGTLKGLQVIKNLCQHFWESAYPSLEFDGEKDPLPRSNAIAPIGAAQGLIGDLRATEISLRQAGKITLGKIERILTGREDEDEQPLRRDQLIQALKEELTNNNADMLLLNDLRKEISMLDAALKQSFGIEYAPDLKNLYAFINLIVPEANTQKHEQDEGAELSLAHESDDTTTNEKTVNINKVKNRTDAIALLDTVCQFLENNDPANPAPHLIRRARNMIGQDFFTILKEIAPDGVSQAENITGFKH